MDRIRLLILNFSRPKEISKKNTISLNLKIGSDIMSEPSPQKLLSKTEGFPQLWKYLWKYKAI